MKIALSLAIAFSILTGIGAYVYLDAAAATAHGERDGSMMKPISRTSSSALSAR